MKAVQGMGSLLQMAGLLARLCKKVVAPEKLAFSSNKYFNLHSTLNLYNRVKLVAGSQSIC